MMKAPRRTPRSLNTTLIIAALCWFNDSPGVARAQGTLTPPAPPGPVMKTLDQVQPRTPISFIPLTISSSGSYYLTTNLIMSGLGNGITITANHVTVDLNGFTLAGNGSGSIGIYVTSTNVTVRNGTISGWTSEGIYCGTTAMMIKDVSVVGNGTGTSGYGMFISGAAIVDSCLAHTNNGGGIFVGEASLVRGCISRSNTGQGIHGANGAQFQDCFVDANGGFGMQLGNFCSVNHCTILNGVSDGVAAADGVRLLDTFVGGNLGSGLVGFVGGSGSFGLFVSGCMFYANHTNGATVGARSLVLNNQFYVNNTGLLVSSNSFNLGGVRVEGNHIAGSTTGLQVAGPGNFIVRNTASGNNVNYVINSNNFVGPIVIPPNSAAINGSTGGAGVGTTDPSANFSY